MKRKPINEISILNAQLTQNACDDYTSEAETLQDCSECNVPPDHTYDSFGMPMHKLQCPQCGQSVEWPKEWQGVKDRWNELQNTKGEKQDGERN